MAIWTLRRNNANIKKMSYALNISETFACVLANRKILTRKDAEIYINPKVSFMYDAFKFKDIKNSIDIIIEAVKNEKKIIVYGDYDVDGIMSTVILYKILKIYGADVFYYIPDRKDEGYGLNKTAISQLHKDGYNLIFTCDNGIAALEEVRFIRELGMEIIILDHHEPGFLENDNCKIDVIPKANAVIDAKQSLCNYPFKFLCAAGMSYKFAKAFFEYTNTKFENEAEIFVLSSIATICDIVDLLDENRIIVKNGLKLINSRTNINKGLSALIKCRQIEGKQITEYNIGFIIGPCINASGRLESALTAVRLFLTDDENEAFELAEKLSELNEQRKQLTLEAVDKVIQTIEDSNIKNDKIFVIYDNMIHESIIGIVAGRIKEQYHKPTIIITDGVDYAKGSGRSIEAYNLFEELYSCRILFEKFGGHAMAAGLSLKHENIDELRKFLNENCKLKKEDMTEIIRIDKELFFDEININLAKELELMKPFGKENKEAIFATKGIIPKRINFVGTNKDIMQFTFIDINNNIVKAISFNGYSNFKKYIISSFGEDIFDDVLKGSQKNIDLKMDIVYSININDYNDTETVQLNIKDFRFCN